MTDGKAGPWSWVAWALVAAAVSVAAQGFEVGGSNNNVFYIPVVLELYEDPQFLDNAFYQSLPDFVSGFWPLLRPITTEANLPQIFLGLHFLTRWLLLLSLGVAAAVAGLRESWLIPVFYLVVIGTVLLRGTSPLGDHDLLRHSLTHTTLANAFAIASLALVVANRHVLGFVAAALAFNMNAFVAVWLTAPLAVLCLRHVRAAADPSEVARRLAIGVALAALLVMPVAGWILLTVSESPAAAFDYRGFLRAYYPRHFMLDAHHPGEVAGFALAAISGVLLSIVPLRRGSDWSWGAVALVAVVAAGAVLPLLTSSPLLLNLHLLRAAGLLQLLVVTLLITAGVVLLAREGPDDRALGFALLVALFPGSWNAVVMVLAVIAAREATFRKRYVHFVLLTVAVLPVLWLPVPPVPWGWTRVASLLLAVTVMGYGLTMGRLQITALGVALAAAAGGGSPLPLLLGGGFLLLALALPEGSRIRSASEGGFAAIAAAAGVTAFMSGERYVAVVLGVQSAGMLIGLAGRSLPLRGFSPSKRVLVGIMGLALCLILVQDLASEPEPRHAAWKEIQDWARQSTPTDADFLVPLHPAGFQLGARREVWTDWKQGAAVMWSPSFYPLWRSRNAAVEEAETFEARLALACREGLNYVVVPTELLGTPPFPSSTRVAFRNRFYSVVPADEEACGAITPSTAGRDR